MPDAAIVDTLLISPSGHFEDTMPVATDETRPTTVPAVPIQITCRRCRLLLGACTATGFVPVSSWVVIRGRVRIECKCGWVLSLPGKKGE